MKVSPARNIHNKPIIQPSVLDITAYITPAKNMHANHYSISIHSKYMRIYCSDQYLVSGIGICEQ